MTTSFAPFTTANAVCSINLLRPSSQPPSGEETLHVRDDCEIKWSIVPDPKISKTV